MCKQKEGHRMAYRVRKTGLIYISSILFLDIDDFYATMETTKVEYLGPIVLPDDKLKCC